MEIDFSNSSKEEIDNFYKILSNNVKRYRLEKNFLIELIKLNTN